MANKASQVPATWLALLKERALVLLLFDRGRRGRSGGWGLGCSGCWGMGCRGRIFGVGRLFLYSGDYTIRLFFMETCILNCSSLTTPPPFISPKTTPTPTTTIVYTITNLLNPDALP
jgi:hypothetical protein